MKKYLFPLLSFAALLMACETEIEYKGGEQDPMLVINCIAEAGSTTHVELSHSIFFIGSSSQTDLSVKDAVVLFEVNGEASTLSYDDEQGAYADDRTLNEGDYIRITASHPAYGTATAEGVVPHKHAITHTESVRPYTPSTDSVPSDEMPGIFMYTRNDSVWKVTLHVDDPIDETNYYRLNLQVASVGRTTPEGEELAILQQGTPLTTEPDEDGMLYHIYNNTFGVPSSTQFVLGINDEDLSFLGIDMNSSCIYYDSYASFVFTDEYLHSTGTTSDIVFDVYMQTPYWWGDQKGWYDRNNHSIITEYIDGEDREVDYGSPWDYLDPHFTYVVIATLETLTPDYYYFLKSSEDFDYASWSLFSEPVTVHSNVEGGLGILGMSAPSDASTFLKEHAFSDN